MPPDHIARSIALFGVPLDAGAGRAGCKMGPEALRVAGLARELRHLGHRVDDRGDLTPDPVDAAFALTGNAKNAALVAGWTRTLDRASYTTLREGAVPVFLGGDHSLAMGTVSGAARLAREAGRPLAVLWLDAHSDFNTPLTSPSGNMHGMPVAFFCGGSGMADILDADRPMVRPQDVYVFGARSIDTDEREAVRHAGINVYDMRSIDELGVVAPIRDILDKVEAAGAMLHVSLDVDFLDPDIAPGVGTTVRGGATYREAHLVMEMIHDRGLATSLDIVELNPFLDDRGKSALLLVELVASLFGRQVFGR
ncbi:arginase [Lichenihabitans psoromatis]|uniref:arginase n=1 Tax=Lichenihabitans psoromatis TaxID=2528642 RepID=UPI0010361F53|nr:arginase [Lichenihabitans psoromatis]